MMNLLLTVHPELGEIITTPVLQRPGLSVLQERVEGLIQPVYLPGLIEHDIVMLVNEEGLLNGLPINENLLPFFFVGNVVFVGIVDDDFHGLTHDQYEIVCDWLKSL